MAVDSTGLTIPTIEELLIDIEQDQRDDIDVNIITEPEEPIGQLNGIFSSKIREAWEALEIAYNGFDPDSAEGRLLGDRKADPSMGTGR